GVASTAFAMAGQTEFQAGGWLDILAGGLRGDRRASDRASQTPLARRRLGGGHEYARHGWTDARRRFIGYPRDRSAGRRVFVVWPECRQARGPGYESRKRAVVAPG